MTDFAHERHKPLRAARPAAGAGHRLCADAEQRQPVANRAGGRMLRVESADLHRSGEARSQDRPRRGRHDSNRNAPHVAARAGQAARDGYRLVGLEQTSNSKDLHHYRIRSPDGAGDWQRTHRTDRRHSRAARRRGGNPGVGIAVQLQRGDGDGDVRCTNTAGSFRKAGEGRSSRDAGCQPTLRVRSRHDDRAANDLAGQDFLHAIGQFVERDFIGDVVELRRRATGRPAFATSRAARAAGIWPSRCRPASRRGG